MEAQFYVIVKVFPQSVLDIEYKKIRLSGENKILYLPVSRSLTVRKLKTEIF